jgi:hypothetical protein
VDQGLAVARAVGALRAPQFDRGLIIPHGRAPTCYLVRIQCLEYPSGQGQRGTE